MIIEEKILVKIVNIIEQAEVFHIYSHANPDGDAIASLAAINFFLNSLRKKTIIRCDTKPSPMFEWINLTLEDGHFISSPDAIIAMDMGSLNQMGKLYNYVKKDFSTVPVINIDHHYLTNDNFGTVNLVLEVASTTLIIYELFKKLNFPITESLASMLYYGLISDTYYFQKANTKPDTLVAAAELAKLGANPAILSQRVHKTKSESALRLWGEIISTMKVYSDGEIVVGSLDRNLFQKYKTEEQYLNLDGLINFMTCVQASKITVLLKERPDEIRISFRSDLFNLDNINEKIEVINVSKIAKQFGGGGHLGAAGCSLNPPLELAEETVIKACLEAMKDQSYYVRLNKDDMR